MDTTYSLRVVRVQDIRWKPRGCYNRTPDLFVNVKWDNQTKQTRLIQGLSPSWDETFSISAPTISTPFVFEVKHKRSFKFRSSLCIGSCHISLSELLTRSASDEVIRLDLHGSSKEASQSPVGAIYVRIENDVSATVDSIRVKSTKEPGDVDSVTEQPGPEDLASKAALDMTAQLEVNKSKLYLRTRELTSRLGVLLKFLGPVSELNPYTKIAFSLCTVLCQESLTCQQSLQPSLHYLLQLVSNQFITDKALEDLVEMAIAAFDFVKDASMLRDKAQNYAKTIDKLLQQTIELCRFVKQYLSHGFFRRMVETNNNQKINDFKRRLTDLKNALDSNIALHTAFVSARISDTVDVLEQRQRLITLKDSLDPFKMDAWNNPLCLPGTRQEILNKIMDWVLSDTPHNIFWLHGVAGSGKSTINATIAERCRDMSCLGAFLFFKRGHTQDESIVPTIAFRLASFDPAIAKHITAAVEKNNGIAEASVESQFEKLLLQPLTVVSSEVQAPIIIILDALDEYGTPGTRRRLLQVLRREIPNLPSNFRFLITSRREPDIEKAFSIQAGSKEDIRTMELDYTSDMSRRDVHSYLEHEIRRILEEEVCTIAEESLGNIITHLSESAAGLFICAATIVKLVSEHDSPLRKLNELASDTRTLAGIDQIHASILQNSTISWDDGISKD